MNTQDMEAKIETTGFVQVGKTTAVIFNDANYDDEVELQLGNYEIEVRGGKTYAVKKKPVYPKTIPDCCKVIDSIGDYQLRGYKHRLLFDFQNLLICRDAYWKVAGEHMGLNGAWEPNWPKTEERKFCIIRRSDNTITKWETKTIVTFLAFPTEEMRDAFYENFKELIEYCKEFL